MSNETLRRFAKIIVPLGLFLSASDALAADYSLDFGVATNSGKDAGSLECQFGEACSAKLESLGLRITFFTLRRTPERVTVRLEDSDVTCCYFAYSADKIEVDPRRRIAPVSFFKGRGARGGLHIENVRAGTLYLRFNSH